MIYDLTMFVGELDLLEIRLEELKDVVDKFIILEPELWHDNTPKPLFYLDNLSRFDRFKDKIIYKTAKSENVNFLINYQIYNSMLLNYIPNPKSDDIIHFSDLDEICHSHSLLESCKNLNKPLSFETDYYMLCCDLWARKDISDILLRAGWINNYLIKYRENRESNFFTRILDAGFHYSSVGTPENIVRKFTHFGHALEVDRKALDTSFVREQIVKKEWFGGKFQKRDINYQTAPRYLVNNKDKYPHLFSDFYDK